MHVHWEYSRERLQKCCHTTETRGFLSCFKYMRFQGYSRPTISSKKNQTKLIIIVIIITIIIIPACSHPLFTFLIFFPNQTTASKDEWVWTLGFLLVSVEKAEVQNQTKMGRNQAKHFFIPKILNTNCFFTENLKQTRNSIVLNQNKTSLLYKVLDLPSSPDVCTLDPTTALA